MFAKILKILRGKFLVILLPAKVLLLVAKVIFLVKNPYIINY